MGVHADIGRCEGGSDALRVDAPLASFVVRSDRRDRVGDWNGWRPPVTRGAQAGSDPGQYGGQSYGYAQPQPGPYRRPQPYQRQPYQQPSPYQQPYLPQGNDTYTRDTLGVFNLKTAMAKRNLTGAPGTKEVAKQLARWREQLS